MVASLQCQDVVNSWGGTTLMQSDNWLDSTAESCSWQFIECDESREEVVRLATPSNNYLKGVVPLELQCLPVFRKYSSNA